MSDSLALLTLASTIKWVFTNLKFTPINLEIYPKIILYVLKI
jgi:hypothetical protein